MTLAFDSRIAPESILRHPLEEIAATLASVNDPITCCEALLTATKDMLESDGAVVYRYDEKSVERIAGAGPQREILADEAAVRLAVGRRRVHEPVAFPGRYAILLRATAVRGIALVVHGGHPARLDPGTAALLVLAADASHAERVHRAERENLMLAQRQMEAYALDLRETYQTADTRSRELRITLESLERTYEATVQSLALAAEAKDEATGGHLVRVQRYGAEIARRIVGEAADGPAFRFGFLLHDIGKLAVPDAVLRKPGPLDDAEWIVMRSHPEMGARILGGVPFLEPSMEIVSAHHERWDGKGYPLGLAGDEIPLGARIFSVVDAFDAMTSDRPYRKALSLDDALAQVGEGRGTQFWADAVDAFFDISPASLRSMMRNSEADNVR